MRCLEYKYKTGFCFPIAQNLGEEIINIYNKKGNVTISWQKLSPLGIYSRQIKFEIVGHSDSIKVVGNADVQSKREARVIDWGSPMETWDGPQRGPEHESTCVGSAFSQEEGRQEVETESRKRVRKQPSPAGQWEEFEGRQEEQPARCSCWWGGGLAARTSYLCQIVFLAGAEEVSG